MRRHPTKTNEGDACVICLHDGRIVEEPERFAFMRRNLQTIAGRLGETVLAPLTRRVSAP